MNKQGLFLCKKLKKEKMLGQNLYQDMKPESSILILTGFNAGLLPANLLEKNTQKISSELAKHPNTMLQYTEAELIKSINEGRSILALGKSNKLIGYGQLWEYGINSEGNQIFEFGSWLSFKPGVGSRILIEAAKLGKKLNPKAQLVAITEEENLKAQQIILKAGGLEIGSKFSPVIRTVEGEAASMKIFDISQIGGTYEKTLG